MTRSLKNTLALVMLGLLQVQSGEIFRGREAAPHSRPFMVLLKLKVGLHTFSYCGGFLISDEFVLTAAHCRAE
ncbi:hypothetical protein NHX12_033451 [Muraenolepis orangiensis]|uniref:Peptidase S1 domain-containing protein n=1 Tax=Muraenolepis orangiensis TaxID=630683 RepID=A0A9Q0E544_9TELE|nr:hypothetical protein NHX12_033451 [Muraenolepis orangiensis]